MPVQADYHYPTAGPDNSRVFSPRQFASKYWPSCPPGVPYINRCLREFESGDLHAIVALRCELLISVMMTPDQGYS